MNSTSYKKDIVIGIISGAFSLFLIYLLGKLLYAFNPNPNLNLPFLQQTFAISNIEQIFAPEPTERLVYEVGIIAFPILTLIFMKMIYQSKFQTQVSKLYAPLLCLTFLAIIYLFWIDLYADKLFYLTNNYFFNHGYLSIFFFAVILVLAYMENKNELLGTILSYLYLIVSVFSLVLIFSINIYNLQGIVSFIHFNAIFHSVSQVYLGKALDVDLTSQYGLYGQIMLPLLKITGLSIFKFTIIFSTLLVFSFGLLFLFLRDIIGNKTIAFIGFNSILFFEYFFTRLLVPADPYFQYYPLRMLFPSLLIFLSWKYLCHSNKVLYYLSFFLYAVGILWNVDSGLVVYITWILILIYSEMERPFKEVVKNSSLHILTGILCFFATVFFYSLFVKITYGYYPDLLLGLSYEKLFYINGFYMIPMNLIHPWNLIILTYIFGLVISLKSIVTRNISLSDKMIFLLSILGTGLFSYYQGRSHDYNLPKVIYPALILIVIYCDHLFKSLKNKELKNRHMEMIIFFCLFYVVASFAVSLTSNYSNITKLAIGNIKQLSSHTPTATSVRADFIKQNTKKGEEILIFSHNSGIYYLESNTSSSLNIPGTTELFLKEDVNKIVDFLSSKSMIQKKVFIDIDGSIDSEITSPILNYLVKNYNFEASTQDKGMVYFSKSGTSDKHLDNNPSFLGLGNHDLLHLNIVNSSTPIFQDIINNRYIGGVADILTLQDSFSIEFLAKPSKSQVPYANIIGNHPGYNNFEGFVIQQDNLNENTYIFSYGTGNEFVSPISFKLNENQMNYVAINVDGKSKMAEVFVNGQLVQRVNLPSQIKNSQMKTYIGNWINSSRPFNGNINEIKISNDLIMQEYIQKTWLKVNHENIINNSSHD